MKISWPICHEGDRAEQQKREKKDARDAAHVPAQADSPLARFVPRTHGEFELWFDTLRAQEFEKLWADPAAREAIERMVREPGGHSDGEPWEEGQYVKGKREGSWTMKADDIEVAMDMRDGVLVHSLKKRRGRVIAEKWYDAEGNEVAPPGDTGR